jgi:hypothetical protein
MSDTPQVINTLRTKADRLNGIIGKLEADLAQARADLSHVNATIRLFEAPESGEGFPTHMNLDRLFKRREIAQLCAEALQTGPMNTRELALHVIRAKGFDEGDRHLRTAIAYRIVQALRQQEKRRGAIQRVEKVGNVVVWSLPIAVGVPIGGHVTSDEV